MVPGDRRLLRSATRLHGGVDNQHKEAHVQRLGHMSKTHQLVESSLEILFKMLDKLDFPSFLSVLTVHGCQTPAKY